MLDVPEQISSAPAPAVHASTSDCRFLALGSMSLAGVLTLLASKVFWERKWDWMIVYDHLGSHVPPLAVEFLPVPLAFLLWLRQVERERPLPLCLSLLWILLSLACYAAFSAVTRLAGSPQAVEERFLVRETLFGAGAVAGLFAALPLRACWERARDNPRLSVVALLASSSSCAYYGSIDTLWKTMCGWTTQVVYGLLYLVGAQVTRAVRYGDSPHFEILSSSFSIGVYIGCSGFEGIFLFFFLFSFLLLCDWDHFKTRRVAPWYVAGMVLMFLVNALRIATFYLLGYWAYQPHAWRWVRSLRGAPLYLFVKRQMFFPLSDN